MSVAPIAKKFGMTVDEFAKCIGYSRQALYSPECFKSAARNAVAIAKIRSLNAQMYQQERDAALRRFKARERAVKTLENKLLQGGDSQ